MAFNMFKESLLVWLYPQSILVCFSLLLFIFWCLRRPQNLPPGPWGMPIVGAFPSLAMNLYWTGFENHQLLAKFASKYGKIFSMQLGGTLIVVLNGYDCIKEAFQNKDLNDRPPTPVLEEMNMKPGVTMASGESWKQQRRFTLSTLRNFGVGKRRFEEQISIETKALVDEFLRQQSMSFDPCYLIGNAVSNVICSVVFGKRYEYSDGDFKQLLGILNRQSKLVGSGGAQLFFPIIRYIQPKTQSLCKENFKKITKFMRKIIDEHHRNLDPENTNDFIDVFLKEIVVNQTENTRPHLNEDTLTVTVTNLFRAGSETTTTTLRWGLLYMIAYPDIQHSIQQELDDVVGRNHLPSLSDISKLPYTEATLLEIQRISTILPLGGPHCAAEDTTLNGFNIPKGAFLISNLWAVHHDPEVWKDPSDFRPSRFLDESRDVRHRQELIPFSTGRRSCLGENLAKMELVLFFTHLLHQFTFSKPIGSDLSFEGIVGFTNAPKPFKIIATPRE